MDQRKKNPAAVSLGKRGAKARWSKLSEEERKEHGRKLTDARLAKRALTKPMLDLVRTIAAQETDDPESIP